MTAMQTMLIASRGAAITTDAPFASIAMKPTAQSAKNGSLKRLFGRFISLSLCVEFTWLTNGFSKKLDNHMAAIALHSMHYNFACPHTTLADPYPRTPAMAASVADRVWSMTEIAALLD
jgi:hypothetical protein